MIDILKSTIQSRINLVILIILGFMALTDAYSKEVVTNADKSNILQKTTQLLKERKYKHDIQQLEQDLKLGVPATLLSNRPDVMSAEYGLIQSFELTNVARSNFYPSLTLTASGGFQS